MLNKTSISALRALIVLASQRPDSCWSPRKLAEALSESPTYLAKVVRHMVKVGILEAEKGAKGGVRLIRRPEEVTLLSIVEACQGAIVGDFCKSSRPASGFCAFHMAALELHDAITGVLIRWTLADLLQAPGTVGEVSGGITCLMTRGLKAPLPAATKKGSALARIEGAR